VPPPFLVTSGPVSFGQQVIGTTTRRTLDLTIPGRGARPEPACRSSVPASSASRGGCGTIAPHASCSLTLTFLPTGITTFNARLDIVSNHAEGVVQVPGERAGRGGAAAGPRVLGRGLGFANQLVGTAARGRWCGSRTSAARRSRSHGVRSTDFSFTVSAPAVRHHAPAAGLLRCHRPVRAVQEPARSWGAWWSTAVPAQGDSVSLVGRAAACRGRDKASPAPCAP
jgi:hypothetical protein